MPRKKKRERERAQEIEDPIIQRPFGGAFRFAATSQFLLKPSNFNPPSSTMAWKWERMMSEAKGGVSSSSSSSVSSSSDVVSSVLQNYPLMAALVAFVVAQLIKFVTAWKRRERHKFGDGGECSRIATHELEMEGPGGRKAFGFRYKERRWDPKHLLGSGGMPSSHSATVTALAVAIGFQDGFGGSIFAASAILACVVMHDAFGVRLQAGRQAEVLNQIVYELPDEHPLADARPLRELLGHTPLQVTAGGMLGLVVSISGFLIKKGWSQL